MTLYIVQARGTDRDSLVRARFIKEGFAWGAFAFGWLWLLYRRLWLVAAAYLALEIAFYFLVVPHVAPATTAVCDLLLRLFVGLEGSRLRVAQGARRAAIVELIEARDRDAAEGVFFGRHAPEGSQA